MRNAFNGNFPITQTFGNDLVINGVHIYAQYGYKGHNGIDYGLPTGTPIVAPHDGTIIEAYFDPSGYGNYIKIENPIEGSVLAHMKSFSVVIGQTVKQGDLLGYSDNTGNSTGPHLHHGYYRTPRNRQNGYGGFIDQTPFNTSLGETPMTCIPTSEMNLIKQANIDLKTANERLVASLALKDKECEQKLQALKAEIVKKINNLASSL